ncbi:Rap/ran-GAP family protein [Histomonas meleagridis]|uniref:Rap/ran-GAP family protein n=1 Tax=Histomonas meleagridis TaxID=135588 RepID=UPI00355A1644|nr:Rap/ran-GAP family protein [Histomonas meleagridis]KAH0805393.1 Rap/ran-GAP family protein [Histomonas meleagridis]
MPPHIKNTENKKAPKLNFDNKLKAYFPDVNNEDEIFEELLEIEPSPIEDVKFEFEMSTENHSIYNEKTVNLANSIKALQKVPQSIDFTLLFYKMADIESCQETDERLKRKLIPVLTHIPRECLKIGIVYVKHDQFDQQEILSNTIEDSSPLFNDFLLSLGKLVNLRKHNGYDGLLDTKNCSTGTHSIYYKNNRMEIMFHVATMMPTKENDPQIIIKKRHIGNDNVQIVWCENPYGYDPSTISSHFNDAHIVIYPYDKETYKVSVYKKNAEWLIFPLPKCTIMTAEPLSALVRCTAIVADRVVRDKIEMPLLTYNNLYEQILQ